MVPNHTDWGRPVLPALQRLEELVSYHLFQQRAAEDRALEKEAALDMVGAKQRAQERELELTRSEAEDARADAQVARIEAEKRLVWGWELGSWMWWNDCWCVHAQCCEYI